MADISLGHESYFSRSLPGSKLARHLDERHEETKGDDISLISNMYMRIITKIVWEQKLKSDRGLKLEFKTKLELEWYQNKFI